jgi:UDP-N-acetylglucosamine 2-epimerase (non-hydrolysing)
VVTGNTIVDVMMEYLGQILTRRNAIKKRFGVETKQYGVMTLHRDETMKDPDRAIETLYQVGTWARKKKLPIVLIVMPRLRKIMQDMKFNPLEHGFIPSDPLGMFDFMALERDAAIEFTDSGTNQETSAIFGVPCVVTRTATERPETFDSGITVMEQDCIERAADSVFGKAPNPKFSLGDGNAADIIIEDLVARLDNNFAAWNMLDPFVGRHFKTFTGGMDSEVDKIGCWF